MLDFVANCERIEMIDQLQKGVQAEVKAPSSDAATDETAREREAFTLTLDGVEFDERVWQVFEVVRDAREGYTEAILEAQLEAKATALGRAPTRRDIDHDPNMASIHTFLTVFQVDTWNEVLKKNGLSLVRQSYDTYSATALKAQLLAKTTKLGRIPTPKEVNDDPEMAASSTFYRMFCDHKNWKWATVLRACGLDGEDFQDYTRSGLEEQLRRKKRALGRVPSSTGIRVDPGMPGIPVFIKAFGVKTWNEVLKAMGWQVHKSRHTTTELSAQLMSKFAQLGRTPGVMEVEADPGMASINTFKKAFSTDWQGVIAFHNLPPYIRQSR